MYNETCGECGTRGNEYLINCYYCLSCASSELTRLEDENYKLKEANERYVKLLDDNHIERK